LLPTPTARGYGSNRSRSAGAARRPSLAHLAGNLLPTPTAADSRSSANATSGRTTASRGNAGSTLTDATRLLPTPRRSDAQGPGRHGTGGPDLRTTVSYLPTPRGSDGTKGSPAQRGSHGDLTLPAAAVAIDTDHPPADTHTGAPARPGGQATPAEGASTALWGPYTEAVDRWQQCLGRPSPAPTQPGRHGRPVLAPRWVEWLMGLPDGWVTELGLPRTVALRLLGNGVVPQQAAAALRALLLTHAQQAARS
jgi:DNA (cytosine-5)-methyltransferase 1